MSIGPLGFIGSVASTPASQIKGEAERTRDAAATQERRAAAEAKSSDAAGIGKTDGDQAANDRDADGRRLYEDPPTPPQGEEGEVEDAGDEPVQAKDPTGTSGGTLDLTG